MTPNDLLYSPLSQENLKVLVLHGLPCNDRDIIQYLLYLYRTNGTSRQLLVAMESLSESWEKVGNSCDYRGETSPHRTLDQRNAEFERRNHELYQQWKNNDAGKSRWRRWDILDFDDEETKQRRKSYVLPPPVIPVDDDSIDYGFSE